VLMRLGRAAGVLASGASRYAPAAQGFMAPPAVIGAKRVYTHETPKDPNVMYATTVLSVRKNGKVVIIGDGQVRLD